MWTQVIFESIPCIASISSRDSPTLYVLLPRLHSQVGQHSSSPAGTATPPRKSQEGDLQSTSYDGWSNRIVPSIYYHNIYTLTAQSVALVHTCPQPLEQHFLPGPQSKPTAQLSTRIPNPVGSGQTTALSQNETSHNESVYCMLN